MDKRLPYDSEFWTRKKDGVTAFVVDFDEEAEVVTLQWPQGRVTRKRLDRFLAEMGGPIAFTDPALTPEADDA